MTSPDTGTRAVRAAVISWVVVVPALAAFAGFASLLTGAGVALMILLVGLTFWVARAVLTVFARLGPGQRRQILMFLVAASVALPAIAGVGIYQAVLGHRVDAVVTTVVDPNTRIVADPATGRELGRILGSDGDLGTAGVGATIPVLSTPELGVEPVAVERAWFGRGAAVFWLVGWLAGAGLIASSFARRRREAAEG
jgi:hypothetical protein